VRKLVLTFSLSHNVVGQRTRVRPSCVEKLKRSAACRPPAGRRERSTFRHRCLAARIPRSSAQPPSVVAVGRFCRSEMSAYITLRVSVVDPAVGKTISRLLSSNAGNFFDSSGKVLIVEVARTNC
jgi:hypothetical protein